MVGEFQANGRIIKMVGKLKNNQNGRRMVGKWQANGRQMVGKWQANGRIIKMVGKWLANCRQMVG